ncbi:glucose 1-dehydrogenase [Fodinisporobacter ferrooxydans]|uniref:Glucose 1-dehydrogenase n=1 Tax=Fodinisporobacter ferrooxydans TaxID=2901836 RepID=A0ABY4CPZ4_9BACL|nr:glucose 1-dehydrogenase [Alicyclobacillaceae bacterium MYW30-H2]
MKKRLDGRIALVTGGCRGIGEAIAIRLAEEGAHVAINYFTDDLRHLAEHVQQNIQELGCKSIIVQADVGNRSQVIAMYEKIEQELGAVDILVNNAGIAPFEPFMKVTDETWDRTFHTNVKGIFICSQLAAKGMIERTYGKIINVLSTASLMVTSPVIPHYLASKAAGHMLTKGMAIELGRYGINVNAVGPSTTDTEFCKEYLADPNIRAREIEANPMKRLGTARQIGDAVVFLASAEAAQVNGHLLMVDGGLTVKAAQPDDHMER